MIEKDKVIEFFNNRKDETTFWNELSDSEKRLWTDKCMQSLKGAPKTVSMDTYTPQFTAAESEQILGPDWPELDKVSNVQSTLDERGSRYGDFTDHAELAQELQDSLRERVGWLKLSNVQKQALTVICDKIARILSGDPNYADNWHDIQGYARLVEERLLK